MELREKLQLSSGQTLLPDTLTTGNSYADKYGRELVVVEVLSSQISVVHRMHPHYSDDDIPGNAPVLTVDDSDLKATALEMIEDGVADDEDLLAGLLTSNRLDELPIEQLTRIIIRTFLCLEVIRDDYPTLRSSLVDVYDDNYDDEDVRRATCPDCFMVKPLSGIHECF